MAEIKHVKLSQIKPNPTNPRVVRDDSFKKLVESVKEFPQMLEKRSLVCYTDTDGKLVVLGGNQRLKALREIGAKEAPVILADDWTAEQKEKFILYDNADVADWNWAELSEWQKEELADWGEVAPDFGGKEIEAVEDDYDIPDEIQTDIVLGDLFEIGEHRLLCGDSTDSDSVAKLMNGEKSEITFTSPPYNAGGNENIPNSGGLKYETYTDNKTEDDYFDFLCGNINAILPHTKEIFYNIGLIEKSKRSINKLLFQYNDIFKDIIYWNKSTVAPHIQPGIINNKIEFILCFGNGSRKFVNAQFSQGTYWNVIEGPNASGNEYAKIHKATFPLYLPENIINNFSNKNAIVLDCFGGTGTTMVAAHQLKRKAYLQELDPKYCQVIVDRMLKLDPTLTVKRNGLPYKVNSEQTANA